jgi:WD40 repeat protein
LVRFSPDGSHLLTAGRKAIGAPSDLTIWQLPAGVPEFEARVHSSYAYSAEFNHDGTRFFAAGEDGNINVWDVKTGDLISSIHDVDSILSARFLGDSNKILSMLGRGDISIWGTDGRCEANLRHPVAFTDTALDPSNRLVAVAGIDGAVVPYLLNLFNPS